MAPTHTDNAAIQQDIEVRRNALITDINSGAIDKVRSDMIDDAKKYGPAAAQKIYEDASRNANMVKLGFPSGSFLTGVQGDRVVARSGDAQHTQYTERSASSGGTGDVQTSKSPSGAVDLGTRGHSTFAANPDGSGTVTIGQGDALWTVAQKVIEQRQGRATQTDIGNLVNEITALNRQTNPNFNPNNPPRQFNIPADVRGDTGIVPPTPYDPARPGSRMATTDVPGTVRPDAPANLPANGEVTAPVAPPGLGAKPGAALDDHDTWWRNVDKTETAANGDVTRAYSGGLYNSSFLGIGRTHFNATETVDKNGVLQHSHVDYTNPASMTIKPENGPQQTLDHVKSVDVQYNPGTGGYTTTYVSREGNTVTTHTDRDGHVRIGRSASSPQAQAPYATGWDGIN